MLPYHPILPPPPNCRPGRSVPSSPPLCATDSATEIILVAMIAADRSIEHLYLTSSPLESSAFNTLRYFISQPPHPSSPLTFDLRLPPTAQPHYTLPVPVSVCLRDIPIRDDVIDEYDRLQQQPARDLDPMTSPGSRLNGDVILPQQRVSVEPTQSFKTPSKRRGISLL